MPAPSSIDIDDLIGDIELPDDKPVFISVDQLAARYQVSENTIWRWRRDRQMPQPYRIVARTRWRLDEIEAWECSRKADCS